jgi:hypothetical protein
MVDTVRSGVWVAKGVHKTTWDGLTTTTVYGAPTKYHRLPDKNVSCRGTFGAGGAVALQGSNKDSPVLGTDADWFTLQDVAGNNISLTAANPTEQVLQNPLWIRPKVTAGDGTTNIICEVVAVGGN